MYLEFIRTIVFQPIHPSTVVYLEFIQYISNTANFSIVYLEFIQYINQYIPVSEYKL